VKQFVGMVIKCAVSIGLIALFFRQIDWHEIEAAAVMANVGLLSAAIGVFFASNVLGAFQWRLLLQQQNISLPLKQVVVLYFVGVFFNNFMIGNIGGDAMRIYDLRRITGRGISGFAATFLDRFIGLFALSCFSVLAYVFSSGLWEPALTGPILALGTGLLGVLCFGFSRRLSGFLVQALGKFMPIKIVAFMQNVRDSFLLYRRAYRILSGVALLACGVQVLRVWVYYLVGLALGQTVTFVNYLVFIPMIAITSAVPISFGGIGIREQMGKLLFGRVGMQPAMALTMMFLGYLAGIAASLIGGMAFVLRRPTTPIPEQENPA
jgi:uncharacterized protein (TIRG00374 family)